MAHNTLVIIETGIFFYLSFLTGDLFLAVSRLNLSPTRIRWVYKIMLGIGVFGMSGVILALAGFFTPFFLHLLMLTILISSWQTVRAHAQWLSDRTYSFTAFARAIAPFMREYPVFKFFILLWLAINFALSFAPITAHDTKAYHMPVITDLRQHGRLSFSRAIADEYGWAALTAETIYAIPTTAFFNTTAPFVFQIFQYSLLILLLLVIYEFLRARVRHSLLPTAAVILVLGIFDLQREALHGGYTDLFVYLFGITSALLIVDARRRDTEYTGTIVLSAIFLGVALAVKLTAGFIAVTNGLFLLANMIRDRISIKKAIRYCGAYGAIVFLIAGFWYIKNTIVWGSPLYIGGITLAETIVAKQTVLNMFLFPFLKFGVVEHGDSSSKLVVAGFFVIVYAAGIFALVSDRKRITLTHILLFSFTQLQLMMIFFRTHHTRYMIAALIMLPVLIALIADTAYQWIADRYSPAIYRRILGVSRVCLACVLVIFFIGDIRYFYVKVLYKTGVLTEQEYIKKIGSQ